MVREFQPSRERRNSGCVEWDFILGFIAFLVLWLLVGHKLLYKLATGIPWHALQPGELPPTPHPLLAYGLFVLAYSIMFFMLGQSFHKGFTTMLVGLVGYFILDIWSPPIMVSSGLEIVKPVFVAIATGVLITSFIIFILGNRIGLPYTLPIFGGTVLLGILLMVFGLSYQGDPFIATQCTALAQPPIMPCMNADGSVIIPGNLALSTDSFLYSFFRNVVTMPHLLAWFITYMVLPVLTVTLFAVLLTRKELSRAVMDGATG